ncbi:MAG: hypothetical protein ACI4R9_08385 [Kiritimatiellia bacterium]
MDESSVRKLIWDRKAVVDAKIAEEGFLDLPPTEQDAQVLSLQLGIGLDVARRCVAGAAAEPEFAEVRAKAAEAFRYGKRKALRALRTAIANYPKLRE